LEKFYKVPKYYNATKKEDLIGALCVGLAPHTSAGVTCRIIGYTKARLGFGHPYFVCAKRRNCLPYNEQVIVETDKGTELIKIGDLAKDSRLKSIHGINAITITSEGKTEKRRILEITERKSPKTLLEFETNSGRKISVTKQHELLTLFNGKLIKKKAHDFALKENLLSLQNEYSKKFGLSEIKDSLHFGDFAVDPIRSIREIPIQSEKVYDLVVEGEKNYVAGTGFLAVYDCDGDQDSLMLLMDTLLNFSQKFLANKSGGKMDAPIVFTTIINPSEVDDEVHKMETCWQLPLELYEKAKNICEPNITIELVKDRLGKPSQYSGLGYTHDTEIFDEGPKTSRYIQLKTMDEKIQRQNNLQKKILAVNAKDALEKVMGSHFLPDIIGNARAFSRQTFRCTSCNEIYRRVPLSGKCYKCGKNTIILTIHEGSVRKYLKIAQNMARQENLSPYLIQRLDMIEKEINSVFKSDAPKQKSLFEFA
jgi:DNA polymerase II large subunit